MNPDIKALWLEALRNGKYRQGRHRLRYDDEFCCLGVLCDLAVQAGATQGRPFEGSFLWSYGGSQTDSHTTVLPNSVMEWAGLKENIPSVGDQSLAYYNDGCRHTFKQIADLIDKHL
jgi:hypothetical protein